jgi:hypothetical protein
MSATTEPASTSATATDSRAGVTELAAVIARLRSMLARVSAGEIVASPTFEQRLYGGLVALEAVAAGAPISIKTLVERWSD